MIETVGAAPRITEKYGIPVSLCVPCILCLPVSLCVPVGPGPRRAVSSWTVYSDYLLRGFMLPVAASACRRAYGDSEATGVQNGGSQRLML